jgi:hypothetical protein
MSYWFADPHTLVLPSAQIDFRHPPGCDRPAGTIYAVRALVAHVFGRRNSNADQALGVSPIRAMPARSTLRPGIRPGASAR